MANIIDRKARSGLTPRQRQLIAYALGAVWFCYSAALLAWDLIAYPPAYTCVTRR